jgi:hypothetical protein
MMPHPERPSISLNYFPQQHHSSERPTLTRYPPHTASTSISSLFDLDPNSIGVASTTSLFLPLPSPETPAHSLRTARRQTPTNHSPRPRSDHPSPLRNAKTRLRRGYFDPNISGEYTSPLIYGNKDESSSSDDNDPFRFESRTRHTWSDPLFSPTAYYPPPPLPYAHRIIHFIQYLSHEAEEGVKDMWSQMRQRIIRKVGERKEGLERTRKWMGRYEVDGERVEEGEK